MPYSLQNRRVSGGKAKLILPPTSLATMTAGTGTTPFSHGFNDGATEVAGGAFGSMSSVVAPGGRTIRSLYWDATDNRGYLILATTTHATYMTGLKLWINGGEFTCVTGLVTGTITYARLQAGLGQMFFTPNVYTVAFTHPADLNLYSGFDEPLAYFLPSGGTISGSKLNFASVAQFAYASSAYGYRVPVKKIAPHIVSLTFDSVTAGPVDMRFQIEYWRGQTFGDGQSIITTTVQSPVTTVNTGSIMDFEFTPPADCTHLEIIIQPISAAAVTAVMDNFIVRLKSP